MADTVDPILERHMGQLIGKLRKGTLVEPAPPRHESSLGMQLGHHRLERLLGVGGMGEVFAARHVETGETVALKTLPSASATRLYRFKREFRALANVSHRNLIRLHEMVVPETGPAFFTMELLDGRPFVDWVRGSTPDGEVPELDRLEDGLRQLVEGMHHLHTHGCVHRDLKPSNVLVTGEGRVVVLDFGLVSELSEPDKRITHDLQIIGTPSYMAPEQSLGMTVGPAADYYAIGVMVFESLTGHLPHQGSTLQQLLAKHQTTVDPGVGTATIPGWLRSLCVRLLARDPDARPDGPELLELLQAPVVPRIAALASRFVGRSEELGVLHAALDEVFERKETVVVHLRGRGEDGGSALVSQFRAALRHSELVVLHGRCYAQETVPYKGVDAVVDALSAHLRRLPADERNAMCPPDLDAIVRAFPVLDEVWGRRKAHDIEPNDALDRSGIQLRWLLRRVAHQHPLIVHIEDLQWADRRGVELLEALARPPDAPPMLLLLAYPGDADGSAALHQLQASEILGGANARTIEITRLAVSDVHEQEKPELIVEPQMLRRRSALARIHQEIIDFSSERGRHRHFFGREDVLAEMAAWLTERDSGWLLVTGSPGQGKSALLDRWLRSQEEAGLRTAFHFIRRGHLDWAEPQVVQRSLAAQIEVMFPKERDVDADPMYRLEQLLGRVSPLLVARDQRLVLLVDGLDEAMTLGTASKDNPIPKIFPLELPDRVFVVTASRPRYPHLSWLERRTGPFLKIALEERAESNERAIAAYWASLGPTMTPPLADELVQAAIKGAEGNLLHAVKLRELWNKPKVERTPTAVPRGFPGMVDELWQRIGELPHAQRKLVRDGLALICAARESLPLRVVEELLEWDEDVAGDELLPLAREMVLEEPWGEVPAYRPFHESLRELVERKLSERRSGSLATYRRLLATYAAWPAPADEFQRSYALRHRIEHLVEVGDVDAATKTCMDLDFLTTKACAEGVHAVERDVRLAATSQHGALRERLTMLGRLLGATAHWASEVPQALPALLHDRTLTNAPELLDELVGAFRRLPEHPRLRHPLRTRGMARVLQGHQDWVTALAVLPNGRVVSGSDDKTVRVWDVETGRTVLTLHGHEGWVDALAVLPSGRVVSSSRDGTMRVWDVDLGRVVAVLEGHYHWVRALAVLPDGRIISGSDDNTVRVWDAEAGRALATLNGHRDRVRALAVLPDGRIISGSDDHTLLVWDLETGRAITTLSGHEDRVRTLAVLPDGRVVSGSDDKTVRAWDLELGRAVSVLRGHEGKVTAVAALPSGRIVSGADDHTLRIWSLETERAIATLNGHQGPVKGLAVLPEERVVSGADDKTIRVWDVEPAGSLTTLDDRQSQVFALAVLPDGRVVSGSHDGTVRVWDAETGATLATFDGHRGGVYALAVLPDGRVVSGSFDDTVRVWDVETGRALATFHGHHDSVKSLAVLPDGRIVSGSRDSTLRVWNVETERAVTTLRGHMIGVFALAVLPDGRVVSSSRDGTMRVWDVETGHALTMVNGYPDFVAALAVLPDGRVVAGSDDGTLRVWQVSTGRAMAVLLGHHRSVTALAVLADGRVVSSSSDKTLRVWDVDAERAVATVYGDASFLSVVAIGADRVVAGDALGNVWFIDLPT